MKKIRFFLTVLAVLLSNLAFAQNLTVTTSSGSLGSSPSIMIRGISSITAGTAPLYVVDGVPYSGDMNNLLTFISHMSAEAAWGCARYAQFGAASALYDKIPAEDFRKHSWLDPKKEDFLRGSQAAKPYVALKFRPAQGECNDFNIGNAGSNHPSVFRLAATDGRSPQWNIVVTRAEFQSNTAIKDATNNPDPSGKVPMAAYEGTLTETAAAEKAQEILNGQTDSDIMKVGRKTTCDLSFEKSGMYSIVAIGLDASGNIQNTYNLNFGYLNADDAKSDAKQVIMTCGLTVSDKSQWAYSYQATVSGDNLTMTFTDKGKEFVRTYVRKVIPFTVRKNCTEPLKSSADEVVPFL